MQRSQDGEDKAHAGRCVGEGRGVLDQGRQTRASSGHGAQDGGRYDQHPAQVGLLRRRTNTAVSRQEPARCNREPGSESA